MRVGLVRNVGLSAVALLALGLAGCDDNPLEFEDGAAVMITTNPSSMTIQAGSTTLLESRTVDEGSRPTFDEITASVDATCGPGTILVEVAADNEPEVIPPGRFDVTGGTTVGPTCISLSGGGASATVDVSVVAVSINLAAAADTITFETTTQVTATLLGVNGEALTGGASLAPVVWSAVGGTIDQTGLVTGNAVGDVVVTATWTFAGVTATGTTTVTVSPPPPPTLTAMSPATGDLGQVITLTGVFTSVTTAFIDGVESPFTATVVSPTEVTFLMPANLPLGAHTITAGTSGTTDESATSFVYTSLAGFTNGSSEPNDNAGSAVSVTFPFVTNDGISAADPEDFWVINFAAATTVTVVVDWDDVGTDVDFFILDAAGAATCVSFYSKPEGTGCDNFGNGDVAAGDSFFQVEHFSGPDAVYSIVVK